MKYLITLYHVKLTAAVILLTFIHSSISLSVSLRQTDAHNLATARFSVEHIHVY